jgi:hypothetical protein
MLNKDVDGAVEMNCPVNIQTIYGDGNVILKEKGNFAHFRTGSIQKHHNTQCAQHTSGIIDYFGRTLMLKKVLSLFLK